MNEEEFIELFFDEIEKEINVELTKKTGKEYNKDYYEKNKDKLRKYHRDYYRKKRSNELKNMIINETIRDEVNKYHSGKIYKLTHLDKMIYIGSTVVSLDIRLEYHKQNAKNYENKSKIYEYIKNNDNINIEIIEKYKCENKQQLDSKEGEYIMKYYSEILNEKIPIII